MLTPRERTDVRHRLTELGRLRALGSDQRELAHDLLAEVGALDKSAEPDPYFAHNLAVLVSTLDDAPETESLAGPLAVAAREALQRALEADPADLALAHALAAAERLSKGDDTGLARLVGALERPHAGDRLTAAVARAVAAHPGAAGVADRVLARLDAILAREPERETLAAARLELLLDLVRGGSLAERGTALERLSVLLDDAERAFGASRARDLLRLEAVALRLGERDLKVSPRESTEALRLAELLAEGSLEPVGGREPIQALLGLQKGLARRKWLKGEPAARLASVWQRVLARRPTDAAVLSASNEAFEASGDQQSLVDHHIEQVRAGTASADSRTVLTRHWMRRLETGEPSGLPREAEAWLLDGLDPAALKGLTPETAIVFARNVGDVHGAAQAAELIVRVLSKIKALGRSPELLVAAVQRLAESGEPEQALELGHTRMDLAGSAVLRLTLARIHLGAGIRVAEAEPLLRAVASEGGPQAAEARALREQVVNSPDFEASRRDAMLEVEDRLGVGKRKPIRCRVIHGSDKFVLAEMPGSRAPGFYQHWYLRVMIRDQDLADGINVASLTKGTELLAAVRGEDDMKSDRIRVYWVDGGKVQVMARAPEPERAPEPRRQKEPQPPRGSANAPHADSAEHEPEEVIDPPSAEVEASFNIGTDAPALVRIDQVARRAGLLFGTVLPPDGSDGDVFPVRVGTRFRFAPKETPAATLRGAVVRMHVARGPGPKLRYDGVSNLEVVTPGPDHGSVGMDERPERGGSHHEPHGVKEAPEEETALDTTQDHAGSAPSTEPVDVTHDTDPTDG